MELKFEFFVEDGNGNYVIVNFDNILEQQLRKNPNEVRIKPIGFSKIEVNENNEIVLQK